MIETNCFACGIPSKCEEHHVIARQSGGVNEPWNLVPLCFTCHDFIDRRRMVDLNDAVWVVTGAVKFNLRETRIMGLLCIKYLTLQPFPPEDHRPYMFREFLKHWRQLDSDNNAVHELLDRVEPRLP